MRRPRGDRADPPAIDHQRVYADVVTEAGRRSRNLLGRVSGNDVGDVPRPLHVSLEIEPKASDRQTPDVDGLVEHVGDLDRAFELLRGHHRHAGAVDQRHVVGDDVRGADRTQDANAERTTSAEQTVGTGNHLAQQPPATAFRGDRYVVRDAQSADRAKDDAGRPPEAFSSRRRASRRRAVGVAFRRRHQNACPSPK